MNRTIRKQALEVKRQREHCELQQARMVRGEYDNQLFVDRDLWNLHAAEKLLCDLVLKAIETENEQ